MNTVEKARNLIDSIEEAIRRGDAARLGRIVAAVEAVDPRSVEERCAVRIIECKTYLQWIFKQARTATRADKMGPGPGRAFARQLIMRYVSEDFPGYGEGLTEEQRARLPDLHFLSSRGRRIGREEAMARLDAVLSKTETPDRAAAQLCGASPRKARQGAALELGARDAAAVRRRTMAACEKVAQLESWGFLPAKGPSIRFDILRDQPSFWLRRLMSLETVFQRMAKAPTWTAVWDVFRRDVMDNELAYHLHDGNDEHPTWRKLLETIPAAWLAGATEKKKDARADELRERGYEDVAALEPPRAAAEVLKVWAEQEGIPNIMNRMKSIRIARDNKGKAIIVSQVHARAIIQAEGPFPILMSSKRKRSRR